MASLRSKKIVEMAINNENFHHDQSSPLLQKSDHQKGIGKHRNGDTNYEHDLDTDSEPFLSSGSEYIPETSNDSETVETDDYYQFKKNILSEDDKTATGKNEMAGEGIPVVSLGKFLTSTSKVEYLTNSRPWTKKSTCPYCFREITHFPRHLQRNHKNENAVKEFLSMPGKNLVRKKLIDAIRRQGNFISNSQTNTIRPVRRPKGQPNNEIDTNSENSKEKYVVCKNCLGYFSRNYLRRHRKNCPLRSTENSSAGRQQHLSAAQLFAICSGTNKDFYATLRLKDEIFKIMRNDDISKTAMGDVLICVYAESLLRKHKRSQIRNIISNKMRELGRLLITLKRLTGVDDLFKALRPQMFDNFVSATKVISGYNNENRSFKASSLALHMATTLKQVCDVATRLVIQKSNFISSIDHERTLKDIKQLKKLIEGHWNTELSSLALKNLTEKSHSKPKLLPLTSDIVKFQQYVIQEAKDSSKNLTQGNQTVAEYRKLSECVLALTLLLNRKRIGEIQHLTIKIYNNKVAQTEQEEFLHTLSETEKTLTKSFKRVVTFGKGSKPVAILFSKDLQEFINVLLNVRNQFVSENNEYLFSNPKTDNRWLSGYHTLKKLAEKSGVSDQTLFTSTRLRKQIATILQVLSITENEMEQLANFMGHTKKTHQEYYRLPQDIYQTAKVSKLLLAINSGKVSKYKGKTLEEMDGMSDNFDTDSGSDSTEFSGKNSVLCQTLQDGSKISFNASLDLGDNTIKVKKGIRKRLLARDTPLSDENSTLSINQDKSVCETSRKVKMKGDGKRVPWTDKQKTLIINFFKDHIKNKQAPRKHEVEEFVCQHQDFFKNRSWTIIKAYVYNCYK